jgi:hypothetical protein
MVRMVVRVLELVRMMMLGVVGKMIMRMLMLMMVLLLEGQNGLRMVVVGAVEGAQNVRC